MQRLDEDDFYISDEAKKRLATEAREQIERRQERRCDPGLPSWFRSLARRNIGAEDNVVR